MQNLSVHPVLCRICQSVPCCAESISQSRVVQSLSVSPVLCTVCQSVLCCAQSVSQSCVVQNLSTSPVLCRVCQSVPCCAESVSQSCVVHSLSVSPVLCRIYTALCCAESVSQSCVVQSLSVSRVLCRVSVSRVLCRIYQSVVCCADSNPDLYSRASSRVGSALSHSAREASEAWRREATEPFRCGTPASADNKSAARRRKDYGEAVRKFMARPKTAAEFLGGFFG